MRDGLNDALYTWSVANDLHQTNTPPQIKLRLNKALDAAVALNNSINKIDGNGRQIIDENPNYSVDLLSEDMARIVSGINYAVLEASNYPRGGEGVRNHAQREFAAALLSAIRKFVGEEYARRGKPHLFYFLFHQLAVRVIHPRQDELEMGHIAVDDKEVGRLFRQALAGHSSRSEVLQHTPKQG